MVKISNPFKPTPQAPAACAPCGELATQNKKLKFVAIPTSFATGAIVGYQAGLNSESLKTLGTKILTTGNFYAVSAKQAAGAALSSVGSFTKTVASNVTTKAVDKAAVVYFHAVAAKRAAGESVSNLFSKSQSNPTIAQNQEEFNHVMSQEEGAAPVATSPKGFFGKAASAASAVASKAYSAVSTAASAASAGTASVAGLASSNKLLAGAAVATVAATFGVGYVVKQERDFQNFKAELVGEAKRSFEHLMNTIDKMGIFFGPSMKELHKAKEKFVLAQIRVNRARDEFAEHKANGSEGSKGPSLLSKVQALVSPQKPNKPKWLPFQPVQPKPTKTS